MIGEEGCCPMKERGSLMAGRELDELCVNTIRFLSVDAVQKANSGHPGLPMGAATAAYVLWTRFLKHNPKDPGWPDRDRFVLSAGHGSMLLYSLLHLTGYDLPLEQILDFRQWNSRTPGHPERGLTPGVETTTGPLGQGFGNAVGLAAAEAHLAARFNKPGHLVVDHFTYCLASDGDLMEGVASESASLAGHLGLGKLVVIYDQNHVTLSAATDVAFTEDVGARFRAYGWDVQQLADGNDLGATEEALRAARSVADRPSLVLSRTHLGYGSPNRQDTFAAHGSPLGEAEVLLAKQRLGWPSHPPFFIPEKALAVFRRALPRGQEMEAAWEGTFQRYRHEHPACAEELAAMLAGRLADDWDAGMPEFEADASGIATRAASARILKAIGSRVPGLFGGSADLDPSTLTGQEGFGDFEDAEQTPADTQGTLGGEWSHAGRNVHFGVREHGMGAILNGVAAHGGLVPYGSTFLIFSDYMRPPIRLAALMGLHVIYIFTHDSIGLGEDGPTHQPVEQLANLRAVPRLVVIRPADANETAVAWRVALETRDRPVALILTRQSVPTLDRASLAPAEGLKKGAYVLEDNGLSADVAVLASGSEVWLALEAAGELRRRGVSVRVVSFPCWELFDAQTETYRESVLPGNIPVRLAVEAASPQGWHRYVGAQGDVIGVEAFGASAPGATVMREYGISASAVVRKALDLLGRRR
jgi:transketolase